MRCVAKKQLFLRGTAFLSALLLAFGLMLFAPAPTKPTAEDTVSSLQSQYDALEKEQDALDKKLDALKDSAADAKQKADYIQSQIYNTQKQIDLLNQQIAAQNTLLSEKTAELKKTEEKIESYHDLCMKRLRSAYTNSVTSNLNLLLESGSFAEFLRRSEYLRATTAYDNALLSELRKDQEAAAAAKKAIEQKKAAIVKAKSEADAKQSSLNDQYSQRQSALNLLYSSQADLQAEQKKINAQMQALDDQIQSMIDSNSGSSGEYVGGAWGWPLTPSYKSYYFSSYFGWRELYGVPNFHSGLDITGGGIYGVNVVASNAGTIYYCKYAATDTSGYGTHIMIDHGGGNYTLYAHLSAIVVSPGQKVKRGQVIGRVGSTGNSTGPHLHFGMYINDVLVNPYPYIVH